MKLLLIGIPIALIWVQLNPTSPPLVSAIPTTPTPQSPPPKLEDVIYAKINPRVVKIEAGSEIGSGSIVEGNRVITCNHVIEKDGVTRSPITVRMSDKQTTYPATVLRQDRREDLAVLKIDEAPALPNIPLASGVNQGDRVFAFGSPLGKQGAMTEGKVLEVSSNITMDALIKPGSSGGSLINEKGEVVGTNCWVKKSNRKIGIAKPVDKMRSILGGAS